MSGATCYIIPLEKGVSPHAPRDISVIWRGDWVPMHILFTCLIVKEVLGEYPQVAWALQLLE